MVGANPKLLRSDRAGRVTPGEARHGQAPEHRVRSTRWRWIAILSMFIPLSFILVQCGQAPSAGMVAANSHASSGDSFDDRFPAPQFRDRFPTANESLVQLQSADAPRKRTAQAEPAPYRVASLAPTIPYERPARGDQTTLVSLKSSAFPYLGNNPRTDEPFLNVSKGDRRGHRSYGGRVYWQDETYNDNRVLMHVPENFDARKPGVIVVFFHGNGATLERDVRDRQLVPQQISDSGVNAVLLAPQLAVDAADSWPSQPITLPVSTAIPAPPRHSPTCPSSSSATAAASCRRPGAWRWAALAIASAACFCSTRFTASWTSLRRGSPTTDPAFSSAPIRVTPSGTTAS
jgi:hypothetical protein